MTDRSTAQRLAEEYRLADGFRPFLLTLWVLARAEGAAWPPPSKMDLKRKLTRPRDEFPCTETELRDTLAIAISQGLLAGGSTISRLVLASGEAEAEKVAS